MSKRNEACDESKKKTFGNFRRQFHERYPQKNTRNMCAHLPHATTQFVKIAKLSRILGTALILKRNGALNVSFTDYGSSYN